MPAILAPVLRQRFFDNNGLPLAGGKLYSYVAGSGGSTFKDTYANSSFAPANPNPVILDAAGYADVWLDPSGPYLFILKTSADVLLWSVDNVLGEGGGGDVTLRDDLAADSGAGLIGYLSSFGGSTTTTVEEFLDRFKWLNNGNPIHTDGVNSITGSARIFFGNNAPSADDSAVLVGRGLSGSYSLGAHGFRDETTYTSPSGTGFFGYGSYDSIPTIGGSTPWNHVHCYQARPIFLGTGLMDQAAGHTYQLTHTGTGVISSSTALVVSNALGAGPITTQYGMFVDPTFNRGTGNYTLFSGGAARGYHGGVWQMGAAPSITSGAFTTYGGVLSTDTTGTILPNPFFTISNGILTMSSTNSKIVATGANNLQLDSVAYVEFLKPMRNVPLTVATLPSAAPAGQRAYVTDATVTTFATIVAGGGGITVPVYSNGTNWYIG